MKVSAPSMIVVPFMAVLVSFGKTGHSLNFEATMASSPPSLSLTPSHAPSNSEAPSYSILPSGVPSQAPSACRSIKSSKAPKTPRYSTTKSPKATKMLESTKSPKSSKALGSATKSPKSSSSSKTPKTSSSTKSPKGRAVECYEPEPAVVVAAAESVSAAGSIYKTHLHFVGLNIATAILLYY